MTERKRYHWPKATRMWRVLITGPAARAAGGLHSMRGERRRARRTVRGAKGAAVREREAKRWATSKQGRALLRKRRRPEFVTQTAEEIRRFHEERKEMQRARRAA